MVLTTTDQEQLRFYERKMVRRYNTSYKDPKNKWRMGSMQDNRWKPFGDRAREDQKTHRKTRYEKTL